MSAISSFPDDLNFEKNKDIQKYTFRHLEFGAFDFKGRKDGSFYFSARVRIVLWLKRIKPSFVIRQIIVNMSSMGFLELSLNQNSFSFFLFQ